MKNKAGIDKWIVILLICFTAFFAVSVLAANCSLWFKSEEREQPEPVTVTIWTIQGDIEESLRSLVARYEKEHENIRFEITGLKNEVYQSAVENAIVTNELPDIFFYWGYEKLRPYARTGIIKEITSEATAHINHNPILRGAEEGFTFDGEIYALPLYGWSGVLFCNRQIFEEYQLEYPKTYDELLDTIELLKEKGITPMGTSAKEIWMSSLYYMYLVLGEGGTDGVYQAAKDSAFFGSDQFKHAADKMEQLIKMHPWQNNYMEDDAYQAVYQFTEGRTAMLLTGSWACSAIEADNSPVKGKTDVIAFPVSNLREGVGGYSDTFVINKNSRAAEEMDLTGFYVWMMKNLSDICVEEVGNGLPVYESQQIEGERFSLLRRCVQIMPEKGWHPAYDQIFSEQEFSAYYGLLYQLMGEQINAEQFIMGLTGQ